MNNLRQCFARNKKWLLFSLMATFMWGLAAHGYGFLHSSFTHDSLTEFNGALFGNHFKLTSGRFISPIYRAVMRTPLTLPWMIGLLALLWIGLSVFLLVKIFRMDSKVLVALTAGILSVNLTVSATAATFLHDFDCDMFALLCTVLAVYLWRSHPRGWILGAPFVMFSLAIYQSYITVSISLAMFVCILRLLDGDSFQDVFKDGLKAIGMLLLGGVLYGIGLKAAQRLTHISLSSGNYNSLDKALELDWNTFVSLFQESYTKFYSRLVNAISPFPSVTSKISTLLLMIACGICAVSLLNRKVRWPEKLLCLGLLLLLPPAMNLMHILTMGNAHELMLYAFWLTWLFVLLLAWHLVKWLKNGSFRLSIPGNSRLAEIPKYVCLLLVFVLIYSNVQTANAMYVKKDLETNAYRSLMTRVLYKIEDYDDYEPGSTPVAFIGTSDQINEVIPGFEKYRDPNGMYFADVLVFMELDQCQAYFRYILNNPMVFADYGKWQELKASETVAAMPCYPDDGCLQMVDGVLVVKLGEP